MFVCVYAGADGSPGAGGGGGGEEEGPEGQAQPAEAQALRHPPIPKLPHENLQIQRIETVQNEIFS